jgi:hypothetical protein
MRNRASAASIPPPIAFFTIFLVGVLTAAAFKAVRDYALDLNQRETVRVTSPDKQIDAVFVKPALMLITSESDLYLVPKGEPAPSWGAVLRITNLKEPARMTWTRTGLLEFRYSHGCVQKFSNLWHSEEVWSGRRYVELRLAPETDLPCGGKDVGAPLPSRTILPARNPIVHTVARNNTAPHS